MATMHIELLGLDLTVEFDYYGGTNRMITSASLEPNDDPEISDLKLLDDELPEELLEHLLDHFYDEITNEIWDKIHSGRV